MKVLIAPTNIASVSDSIMISLKNYYSDTIIGVTYSYDQRTTYYGNWKFIFKKKKYSPFKKWLLRNFKQRMLLSWYILWADVIIWVWDIDKTSAFLIKLFHKRNYVLWLGSDIRKPEFVKNHNPYYEDLWRRGEYDYHYESEERSQQIQKKFSRIGSIPLVCPEMKLYLNSAFFNHYIDFFQPISIDSYNCVVPSKENQRPLVLHAPSKLSTKGTFHVRAALASLKEKGFDFEYIEVFDKEKHEAEALMKQCDIFLDQFMLGSYGMAACEAMAMGKPVFCYLMQPVIDALPADCPIINTNINNLGEVIESYLLDANKRCETGKLSRAYVEKYHDAKKIVSAWRNSIIYP